MECSMGLISSGDLWKYYNDEDEDLNFKKKMFFFFKQQWFFNTKETWNIKYENIWLVEDMIELKNNIRDQAFWKHSVIRSWAVAEIQSQILIWKKIKI